MLARQVSSVERTSARRPFVPLLILILCGGFLISSYLKKAQADREVAGVGFDRDGPTITHLLFVDDSIVFLEASKTNMESLQRVLAKYECCSGQRVNLQKSSIYFGKGCGEVTAQILNMS
jgi:hypothetical protein